MSPISNPIQYIDKELMIAAAQNMRERADAVDDARENLYRSMVPQHAFGGSGGPVDYPTSYTTAGVHSSSFFPWDRHTFMESGVTFHADSYAPWADDLRGRWIDSIFNRASESYDIQAELARLKRCLMQYLEDTGEVDLNNAGLLEETVDEDPASHRGYRFE